MIFLKDAFLCKENTFISKFSLAQETQRKLIMYYIMNTTSLLVLVTLGTGSFLEGDTKFGLTDIFFCLILLALLHFIGKIETTLILLFLFFLYLL